MNEEQTERFQTKGLVRTYPYRLDPDEWSKQKLISNNNSTIFDKNAMAINLHSEVVSVLRLKIISVSAFEAEYNK